MMMTLVIALVECASVLHAVSLLNVIEQSQLKRDRNNLTAWIIEGGTKVNLNLSLHIAGIYYL